METVNVHVLSLQTYVRTHIRMYMDYLGNARSAFVCLRYVVGLSYCTAVGCALFGTVKLKVGKCKPLVENIFVFNCFTLMSMC